MRELPCYSNIIIRVYISYNLFYNRSNSRRQNANGINADSNKYVSGDN